MAASRAEIVLPARGPFALVHCIRAHGDTPPAPWVWTSGRWPRLRRAEGRPDGRLYLLEIRAGAGGVVLRVIGPEAAEAEILVPLGAAVRRALGLDVDLRPLHRICRRHPALRHLLRTGPVPLLHGTTPFEDVVAALVHAHAPTQGDAILERLVSAHGRRLRRTALRAFPTPAALADGSRITCRAAGFPGLGYALAGLATDVAAGRIDLGVLDAPPADTRRRAHLLAGLPPTAAAALRLRLGDYAFGSSPPVVPAEARPWRALLGHWLARTSAAGPAVVTPSASRPGPAAPASRGSPRRDR